MLASRNEAVFEGPEIEGARRCRRRYTQGGGRKDLLGFDAHHKALAEETSGDRRCAAQADPLGLTPVGGHTRVSDVKVDEGSPKGAGSNPTLYTRVQSRGRSAGLLCHRQTSLPDCQGTWRLGQRS